MAARISAKLKQIIEQNAGAFATSDTKGRPNVIGVACVKVMGDVLLITDNFMRTTRLNLQKNKAVCLAFWDKKWNGCKISGFASYHKGDTWHDAAKRLPENRGLPAKGAVVVKVEKVRPLK